MTKGPRAPGGEPTGGSATKRTVALALGAIGVVYGDIGTSPLYTMRQAFLDPSMNVADESHVLGVCSLIVWALLIIVTIKYVTLVMRADRNGEGGILSLFSLIDRRRLTRRLGAVVGVLGIFGTALLYGDGMITPAISVLSAIEGFEVAAPSVRPYVGEAAVLVLIVLFAVQRRGTTRIARVFAPIMLVWFVTIAGLGIRWIVASPSIFRALLPSYGLTFLAQNRDSALVTLGAVFLAVTGAEALYADLGHFGRTSISASWYRLVLPALILCYLGQSAALLDDPRRVSNPFFEMAPPALVLPLAVLATAATIIASQALISGVFSLTTQAINLGYAPRLRVVHTSDRAEGQVYVPFVNWALLALCVGLIVIFRRSERLASAYGVAVVSTMAITTIMFYLLTRQRWGWSALKATAVCTPLLVVDLVFMVANSSKVPSGGWLPLSVAVVVYVLLSTWRGGQSLVAAAISADARPLGTTLTELAADHAPRLDGTAVYFHRTLVDAPRSLVQARTRGAPVHRRLIFLTVVTDHNAVVPSDERFQITDFGGEAWQVSLHVGFAQFPDVPELLRSLPDALGFHPDEVTYCLSDDDVTPAASAGMARWRVRLFVRMSRAATAVSRHDRLPPDRVVVATDRVAI